MEREFLNAKWVASTKELNSCYIKKSIEICDISSAKIFITGLGFFELFVNGKKVGDDICVPSWTNYCYRDLSKKLLYPCNDTLNYRVNYLEYDISDYLTKGTNEIVVQLANGWFRQNKRNVEGDLVYGDNLLTMFELDVTNKDGSKSLYYTDGSELFCQSEVTESSVYYGETQDYTVDFLHANSWEKVKVIDFDTKLVKQIAPTDKVVNIIKLNEISVINKEKSIFALPYSVTGRVKIKCLSDEVVIRYSEEISNNELDFESCGAECQIQTDHFINAKDKIVNSKFSIYCFRYFEIIGKAEVICVEQIHADVPQTVFLKTNNVILNWIFDSYIRTQLCNMHYGVPSDCPHRERLGYTGDGQLTAESALLALDSVEFYKKWLDDVLDCQDVLTGHVQHTAPFFGGGGGPVGWGGAIAILPLKLYKLTNDISFVKDHIQQITKWFDYIVDNMEHGLIVKEIEGGWCLGDWCVPSLDMYNAPKVLVPAPFVNACMFVKILQEYVSLAKNNFIVIDSERYSQLIKEFKRTILETYYDAQKNSFCDGVQGANLFAIDIGLANDDLINKTIDFYKETLAFDTGIFGSEILIRFLCERDVQTAFDLLVSKSDNTFYGMMKKGATTLYENWNGFGSHNHPMFGACIKDIVYSICGIRFIDGKSKVFIDTPDIKGLDQFEMVIKLNKAEIAVKYNKTDKQVLNIKAEDASLYEVSSDYKRVDNNIYEK